MSEQHREILNKEILGIGKIKIIQEFVVFLLNCFVLAGTTRLETELY